MMSSKRYKSAEAIRLVLDDSEPDDVASSEDEYIPPADQPEDGETDSEQLTDNNDTDNSSSGDEMIKAMYTLAKIQQKPGPQQHLLLVKPGSRM